MGSYDVIEAALSAPIDWETFEKLVAEILVQDDMPRLKRAGGYKDSGIDAYETALYADPGNADIIVQITSQRAQSLKAKATLQRIREQGFNPKAVTFVFRHPVSSTTRTDIVAQCAAAGVQSDVRDQMYLVFQLGKNKTGLFARYFESVKVQLMSLLDSPDPLLTIDDKTRYAVLLSVAAFIMHPHSRLVRQELFQRTTAATLVAAGKATETELANSLMNLLPEEDISIERVATALARLSKSGDCVKRAGKWEPTDACLARFGAVLGNVQAAYEHMAKTILGACHVACGGDQAAMGFAERNFRRALLRLLRMTGPLGPDEEMPFARMSSQAEVRACLSQDLRDDIARKLIVAFGGYVEDQNNVANLALFGRSYSALALRNLDPVGRRWQQMALHRSILAMDTDALLALLIRELPEHAPLQRSLVALSAQGILIVVSPEVVGEAIGHISRAGRTFSKWESQIDRMSPAMADTSLWHAVVRGYYYARQQEPSIKWRTYWNRYYDEDNSEGFVRHQIKMTKCTVEDLSAIPEESLVDLEEITSHILVTKESHRPKAEFRGTEHMAERARRDIRMALHLADYDGTGTGQSGAGYLVTEDRAFFLAERHHRWRNRPRVAVLTRSIPQLAEFICGVQLQDAEVVRLLYEPVLAAAAESLASEIDTLTALGVNLREVGLSRLEWALQQDLHDAIHTFRKDDYAERKLDAGVKLLALASARGLPVDTFVQELAQEYEEVKKSLVASEKDEAVVREALDRVVKALATTKKGRRRANRVLREFGRSVDAIEQDNEEDERL